MARFALLTVALLLSPLPPALASTVSIAATPGKSIAPSEQPTEKSCSTPGAPECIVVDDPLQSEVEADQAGGEDQGGGSGE